MVPRRRRLAFAGGAGAATSDLAASWGVDSVGSASGNSALRGAIEDSGAMWVRGASGVTVLGLPRPGAADLVLPASAGTDLSARNSEETTRTNRSLRSPGSKCSPCSSRSPSSVCSGCVESPPCSRGSESRGSRESGGSGGFVGSGEPSGIRGWRFSGGSCGQGSEARRSCSRGSWVKGSCGLTSSARGPSGWEVWNT